MTVPELELVTMYIINPNSLGESEADDEKGYDIRSDIDLNTVPQILVEDITLCE